MNFNRRLLRQVGYLVSLGGLILAPQLASAARPDDEAIRHQLEDILSRPEFNPKRPEDFFARLFKYFVDFLGWLAALRVTEPIMFWLFVSGLIGILVLLVVHIIWTVSKVLGLGYRPPQAEDLREKRGLLSAAYRQEALGRAGTGDFTEAIRYLFLSLVYRFDEDGKVSFRKAYTNREYLTLFADRPPVHEDLKVFVDTLDADWYGQHPTSRWLYENCLALYESLI